MKKKPIPQYELPGAADVFNLVGETAAEKVRRLQAQEDAETRERFRRQAEAEHQHPKLF